MRIDYEASVVKKDGTTAKVGGEIVSALAVFSMYEMKCVILINHFREKDELHVSDVTITDFTVMQS